MKKTYKHFLKRCHKLINDIIRKILSSIQQSQNTLKKIQMIESLKLQTSITQGQFTA